MSSVSYARRTVAVLVSAALAATAAAALASAPSAQAAITAPPAGTVIRDAGPLTITENRGGQYANLAAATSSDNGLARGCNGGNANRKKADATITVTRVADGVVVATKTHQTSNNLLILSSANASGAFSLTWDTTGATPGTYRIVSTANDRAKIGSASSQACTADTNTVLSDYTVDYRPWQHANFNDLLGYGKVRLNTNPREFQFTVDGSTSPIIAATPAEVKLYASPAEFSSLPSASCVSSPASCLPSGAAACDPADGCTPRFAVINRDGTDKLQGVFDLSGGAFVANATTAGKTRILVSSGPAYDGKIADLIAEAAENGSKATGLDLLALFNTSVAITTVNEHGESTTTEVGLLKGLQITKALAGPGQGGSISINAPFTINAGFSTHTVGAHFWKASDGDPSENVVKESSLLPNLPALFSTPLGALGSVDVLAPIPVPAAAQDLLGPTLLVGGGPLVNIRSTYPDGTGTHTAGTSSTGPSIDTAPGAPSGLPAWVPGYDSKTLADKGPMDFVGYAAAFIELPEINLLGTVADLGTVLIGQGITVYGDSPFPDLGSLPLLWDTESAAAAQLNEITSGLAPSLLSNPAVSQVLTAALSLLSGGTPDLQGVTGALSNLGSFTALLNGVAGKSGLAAVPGLEGEINEVGVVTKAAPAPTKPKPNLVTFFTGLLKGWGF